jgi:hypothetical protein
MLTSDVIVGEQGLQVGLPAISREVSLDELAHRIRSACQAVAKAEANA